MKISDRTISFAALIVALASASFSYLQFKSAEGQLRLSAQQIRPHVSFLPTFFSSLAELRIDMYLQNESPLPAKVIYADVALSTDGKIHPNNFHSIFPDLLYQQRGAVATLPLVVGPQHVAIATGKSRLLIATCAIYSSTTTNDERRWSARAIHEYQPSATLATRRHISELEASSQEASCSAKKLFAEEPVSETKLGVLPDYELRFNSQLPQVKQ